MYAVKASPSPCWLLCLSTSSRTCVMKNTPNLPGRGQHTYFPIFSCLLLLRTVAVRNCSIEDSIHVKPKYKKHEPAYLKGFVVVYQSLHSLEPLCVEYAHPLFTILNITDSVYYYVEKLTYKKIQVHRKNVF